MIVARSFCPALSLTLAIDVLYECLYQKRLERLRVSDRSVAKFLVVQSQERAGRRNIRLYFEDLTKRPAMMNYRLGRKGDWESLGGLAG